MKIYTKAGDAGKTYLSGGERVAKTHPRIEAYGTIDELNAVLGIVRASGIDALADSILERIQHELFNLGANLASSSSKKNHSGRIGAKHISKLENEIDELERHLEPIKNFILPGGSTEAAHLHLARTICRRAERISLACKQTELLSEEALIYLNRLSDLLFVMARYQNKVQNTGDVFWDKKNE